MVLLTVARYAKSLQLLKAKRPLLFERENFQDLPVCYQRFHKEWKRTQPSPVYYRPEEGRYRYNPDSGKADRIVNTPIPLTWAPEMDNMLMGGEAIIKGFLQKKEKKRKVPKWWVPVLHKTVVYSEILNKYMPVIATKRLIELVHHHQGFDNYILQSPACDLRSLLALKIKRKILMSLAKKDLWPDNEAKREEILTKYKDYIVPLEEAEWYGLTLKEALIKNHLLNQVEPTPLKHKYRQELIEYLKDRQENPQLEESSGDSSWFSQLKSKVTLSK